MSYTCCSRNFSSRSLGDHLRYPGASCGSSFPSNLVYSADLCPRSSCQLGSSFYSQETCCVPIRTQTFRVVSRPCQTSCYRPRTPTFSSPCQTTLPGSLGFRSSSCSSLSSGSRSCYSGGCGSRSFRRLGYGICGFPSLGCGSGFCRPTFASRSCHSSCYRPSCGSVFY
nr:keratin-associated protein 13-1-like [Odocoileus virginianus texanus]